MTAKKGMKQPPRPVVAWDGEGIDIDGRHKYIYLSNSAGQEIYDPTGLSTGTIFRFLMSGPPKALNFIYGSSYDVTHFVTDVTPDEVKNSMTPVPNSLRGAMVGGKYRGYEFEILSRKKFTLRIPGQPGRIWWDAFGFFQSSFTEAIEKWFGEDYPDLKLIYEGKALREKFNEVEMDFIRKYNDAELRALVALMETLRTSMKEAGLTISTYHGAGSLATAMMSKKDLKERVYRMPNGEKVCLPVEMRVPAERAYFGGRIEAVSFGNIDKPIYTYDINSAYPAALLELPNIGRGRWVFVENPEFSDMPRMTMFKVRWKLPNETILCPFPYRSALLNKILFPTEGYGWIWYPEVKQALLQQKEGWEISIEEAWYFVPDTDEKPFSFIQEYYDQRKELIEETKLTGKPNGAEKVIKLALNSLYGKQAQRVGANPPFRSTVYAGYITSSTRSELFAAGCQGPESIVCLATDGIYSTKPLGLYCPTEKVLGAWDFLKKDGMLLAQSGHYILKTGDERFLWSRGFDKIFGDGLTKEERKKSYQQKVLEYEQLLISSWEQGKQDIDRPCKRFCTLKSALMGDRWHLRGQWIDGFDNTLRKGKELKIFPTGTKRTLPETPEYYRRVFSPHENMVLTYPAVNLTPEILSARYKTTATFDPWVAEDEIGGTQVI